MATNPTNQPGLSLAVRVKKDQDTSHRLERLEQMLKHPAGGQDRGRNIGRKWRNRFGVALVALVAVSAFAVAAITTATTNFSAAKSDVYVYDEASLAIISQGMDVTGSAVSAAGAAQGSAIEMAASLGAANTALSAGDWFYKIDLKEAGVATLASGTLKAELFVDGTSKGALYVTQATADAESIEGVSLKWSLGASLSGTSAYVVKVSSV